MRVSPVPMTALVITVEFGLHVIYTNIRHNSAVGSSTLNLSDGAGPYSQCS